MSDYYCPYCGDYSPAPMRVHHPCFQGAWQEQQEGEKDEVAAAEILTAEIDRRMAKQSEIVGQQFCKCTDKRYNHRDEQYDCLVPGCGCKSFVPLE